jgi:hypothetical protein
VRGSQPQLEEFSVGSAHLDTVDAVQRKGVPDGLIHKVSPARGLCRLRVDRHDGSLPRKHRKSDSGVVSCLIGAGPSPTAKGTSKGEAENGRQNRQRNDYVHVYLL